MLQRCRCAQTKSDRRTAAVKSPVYLFLAILSGGGKEYYIQTFRCGEKKCLFCKNLHWWKRGNTFLFLSIGICFIFQTLKCCNGATLRSLASSLQVLMWSSVQKMAPFSVTFRIEFFLGSPALERVWSGPWAQALSSGTSDPETHGHLIVQIYYKSSFIIPFFYSHTLHLHQFATRWHG